MLSTTLLKIRRCHSLISRSDVVSAKLTLPPFGSGKNKAKLAMQRFKTLQVNILARLNASTYSLGVRVFP